jgi:CBS domain containing-hemolysin-like protein
MVDVLSIAGLGLAFVLVGLNGFFVAAEFAFVRVRSSSVEQLVAGDRPGANTLAGVMDNLDDYLAVTQLGITIASLGLGWVGEPAVASLIEPVLESFVPESAIHAIAFAIGFGFITFLHVVFGELAPKTIAIAEAERIALLVAPPMKGFYYLFIPGIVVFNGTANAFTRMIGVPPASETEETLSEEEILTILSRSGREGQVDIEEVEMIEHVFELDDTTVQEVMIPRPDVVTVESDTPLADLSELVTEEGHTRYPVVAANDGDDVVGFVDVKDVLRASEFESDESDDLTAGDLARELPIVPESTRINELLETFQTENRQMAAIIDEWGAFEGIATVEDVVEEVVGDIHDEFDEAGQEPSIEQRARGVYVVDGSVTISKVNETLDTAFESGNFDTIGGLILDHLGRAPEAGDRISLDGFVLDVDDVDGSRISTVRIREQPPGDQSGE